MEKTLLFLALLFACSFSFAQDTPENHPESVCPMGSEYYFSNTTAGHIHVIRAGGTVEVFAADVGKVLGLAAQGKTLYAAVNREDGGHILAFQLPHTTPAFDVQLPEAKQLNDIALDSEGTLYVTDRLGDKVYAVNVGEGTFRTLVEEGIKTPNGICVDESLNRLLICNTVDDCSIYSYELESGKLLELLSTGRPHLDGIAMDRSGNIYVTSWSADWTGSELLRYSPIFEEWVMQENQNGMADLYLYPSGDKIALANWYLNKVSIVKWSTGKVQEKMLGAP